MTTHAKLTIEITSRTFTDCDKIMAHILTRSFPSTATARVTARGYDQIDISTSSIGPPLTANGEAITTYDCTTEPGLDLRDNPMSELNRILRP